MPSPIIDKSKEPAAITALRELEADVQSRDDEQTLNEWKAEVGAERAAALANLGSTASRPLVEYAGVMVEPEAIAAAREQGQDMSAHDDIGG